jgi:glyoxylase-like metal-dependent hydrolase (beta-lactamase superfamily II)
MTLDGTNSYLIDGGNGEAICIDPGPAIQTHVEALLQKSAQMNCKITAICLTHGHPDHAPAAALLRERTGALVYAHGESRIAHDRTLNEGDTVRAGDTTLRTIVAPGHSSDHVVFYEARERALFTGDVVIGQGYVLVAPPDGDMRAYLRTLQRLLNEFHDAQTIYGGHGEPVRDPKAKLREYIEHRRTRENQLIVALQQGERSVPDLVRSIYASTDPELWPAAGEQLLAYLIALEREGRVRTRDVSGEHVYSLA